MSGDLPIEELAKLADQQIQRGFTIWMKWTCPNCGSRQTMDEPDVLYRSGHCQNCDTVSPISVGGFMMAKGGVVDHLAHSIKAT